MGQHVDSDPDCQTHQLNLFSQDTASIQKQTQELFTSKVLHCRKSKITNVIFSSLLSPRIEVFSPMQEYFQLHFQ